MSGRLQNKVTIITGGGAGFGCGLVEKFVLEGAKVLIWDIHQTSAGGLTATLPAGCQHALYWRCQQHSGLGESAEDRARYVGCSQCSCQQCRRECEPGRYVLLRH